MQIRRSSHLAVTAQRNRLEIVRAQLSRRDLFKMGLLTATGYLVTKHGLSSRASADSGVPVGPPTRAFVQPMPRPPIQTPLDMDPTTHSVAAYGDATWQPTVAPNTARGEGRTRAHQCLAQMPPQKYYAITQKAGRISISPDLPLQPFWGFAIGTPEMNNPISVPGPTYVAYYGEPILVRNYNRLPPVGQNDGFGLPSASTHLHNAHTPSESDGYPGDRFERGQFYDHHYPNVLAGYNSTHVDQGGDINESMSSLWYHDHRADFTSQNVYKGLAGMYQLFNDWDTGDETTGFRLPSFPDHDVYVMFNDKVIDPTTGLMVFDLFNLDGIIGDKYLANGVCQPYFQVSPRRYRFRLLNGGPSRFYDFFLTDPGDTSKVNPFWQISSDGNLLPRPVEVANVRLAVAERADIIVDFSKFAGKSIYLENRLEQQDGRGPTGRNRPAGAGTSIIRFDVTGPAVADDSADPATQTFYSLPDATATPRVVRTFNFERKNGQWAINGGFFDNQPRLRVKQNSVEHWILRNSSGSWQHPVHIHFEEHQVLSQDCLTPVTGRKDVFRLEFNQEVRLFFRFRDFVGRYPLHCHNVVHEDHSMMLRWDIDADGDLNTRP
jgi:FtsP/CotA-like multicopper oxidase with cupredoxin domain